MPIEVAKVANFKRSSALVKSSAKISFVASEAVSYVDGFSCSPRVGSSAASEMWAQVQPSGVGAQMRPSCKLKCSLRGVAGSG
jgi:hypothetical protein